MSQIEVKKEFDEEDDKQYDLNNIKIVWSDECRYGQIKINNHPLYLLAENIFIKFHGLPSSTSSYAYIKFKVNSKQLIDYFDMLNDVLRSKTPHFNPQFCWRRHEPKSIIACIALDSENKVLTNVYDEDGVLVHKASDPTFTVEELQRRYDVNPGKVTLRLWINCISYFGYKHYLFMSVKDIYLRKYDNNKFITEFYTYVDKDKNIDLDE